MTGPSATDRLLDKGMPAYRAFPEFDPFTDAECQRWLSLSWGYWPRRRFFITLAIPAGVILASIATIVLMVTLFYVLHRFDPKMRMPGFLIAVLVVVFAALPGLLIAVAFLVLRDRWLRDCLRSFIDDRRCLCGYSLLGLPDQPSPQGPFITCPECGEARIVHLASGKSHPGGVSSPS